MFTLAALPDPDEARRWAEEELSDGRYAPVEPNWLDRAAGAVYRYLTELLRISPDGGLSAQTFAVAAGVLIAVAIVVLLVWARPGARVARRRTIGQVFDGAEAIPASEWRARARAALAKGDADLGLIAAFRAMATSLAEREIIDLSPGTTAQQVAIRAELRLPELGAAIHQAAEDFDDVRFRRIRADLARAERLVALEQKVAQTMPLPATARETVGS